MLHSLYQLATETSPKSRRLLLRAVTRLFFYDPIPTVASKQHYGEIALSTLPHIGDKARRSYAGDVAAEPNLPHSVAAALAGDPESEVARLVLRLSPVLTDRDLAAIALNQSQDHLTAIAERARLSEKVTDILVERGDKGVLNTVGGNEGAQFSDIGFEQLLERGREAPEIHRTIAVRSDLTEARAERVMRMLVELGNENGGSQDANDEAVVIAQEARKQRLEVSGLLTDLAQEARVLDEVLLMLAEEDRAYHLAQVIAAQSTTSVDYALQTLLRRSANGISLICRALDVGYPAFAAILALRARRLMFANKRIDDELRNYALIDATAAQQSIRFARMTAKLSEGKSAAFIANGSRVRH